MRIQIKGQIQEFFFFSSFTSRDCEGVIDFLGNDAWVLIWLVPIGEYNLMCILDLVTTGLKMAEMTVQVV